MKFLLIYFILGLVVTTFIHISEYLSLKEEIDKLKSDIQKEFINNEVRVAWRYDLDAVGILAIMILWPGALYLIFSRR